MLVNSSCIIKHLICMHEEPMQFEIDVLKLIYSHEFVLRTRFKACSEF